MTYAVADVSPAGGVRVRGRFFLAISVVQLVVVFLGFAPTFYLDPLFDTRTDQHAMPVYLIVHAVLLTAWYVGLVVQSGLIVRGRKDLHKTLGLIGVAVAVGVLVTGVMATLLAIPRSSELGFPPRERINILVTTNTMNLLVFIALVSVAISKRSNPQIHKRLLLIASLAIIGPAVGPDRMFGMFLQTLLSDVLALPVALFFWLIPVGAMAVYDVLVSRRLHPATVWGGARQSAGCRDHHCDGPKWSSRQIRRCAGGLVVSRLARQVRTAIGLKFPI